MEFELTVMKLANEWTVNDFLLQSEREKMAASSPLTWLRDLKEKKNSQRGTLQQKKPATME